MDDGLEAFRDSRGSQFLLVSLYCWTAADQSHQPTDWQAVEQVLCNFNYKYNVSCSYRIVVDLEQFPLNISYYNFTRFRFLRLLLASELNLKSCFFF